MLKNLESNDLFNRPLELPCGAVLKNRLVKSAMSDSLGNGEGDPTEPQIRLYERWAQGGTALALIGEVQIGPHFAEKPGNLVLGPHSNLNTLHKLATRASIAGAHIWPQLGHGGALSHIPISKPKGPSALKIGDFKCDGMSETEVNQLPEMYAKAATLAQQVGFTGVQIHAGHGFLLSQFLSPLFNRRNDQYGGSIEARSLIIIKIIEKVRNAVGPLFPIGIKINSSDLLEDGLTQVDALEFIGILDRSSVDLIEISGGTYFPGAKASSDSAAKGPYFVEFSQRVQSVTRIPLMAVGGFKTQQMALDSLNNGAVDAVGLARAMALNPDLPNTWMSNEGEDPVFPRFKETPAGGITAWYSMRLTALGNDQESSFDLDLHSAIDIYEERDAMRCETWQMKFSQI